MNQHLGVRDCLGLQVVFGETAAMMIQYYDGNATYFGLGFDD